jgi:hypothetical protein
MIEIDLFTKRACKTASNTTKQPGNPTIRALRALTKSEILWPAPSPTLCSLPSARTNHLPYPVTQDLNVPSMPLTIGLPLQAGCSTPKLCPHSSPPTESGLSPGGIGNLLVIGCYTSLGRQRSIIAATNQLSKRLKKGILRCAPLCVERRSTRRCG